jgi:hypothetical protein
MTTAMRGSTLRDSVETHTTNVLALARPTPGVRLDLAGARDACSPTTSPRLLGVDPGEGPAREAMGQCRASTSPLTEWDRRTN